MDDERKNERLRQALQLLIGARDALRRVNRLGTEVTEPAHKCARSALYTAVQEVLVAADDCGLLIGGNDDLTLGEDDPLAEALENGTIPIERSTDDCRAKMCSRCDGEMKPYGDPVPTYLRCPRCGLMTPDDLDNALRNE